MNEVFKKDYISKKISICYKISTFSNNNLILLSNYDEVLNIINTNKKDLIYFLYSNRHNIHYILYKEEEVINIEINENNRNLFYYFYLSLLITENKDIINYSYSVDYINDIIDNYQKYIEDNNKLKKIIISKILLQIIDNFKNTDKYNEKDENHLKDIEKKNEEIINNNINYLIELKVNMDKTYIIMENIDKIYIDIIISLLEQNKFKDYEYVSNIFNQLELERINITEKMIDKLSSVLDIKNSYINEYLINNIDDLFNNNKINFYFILFKYIIKNNIILYQFPLLIKIRKKILNIIYKNLEKYSLFNHNNNINNKINYILERIIDSKYYLDYILQPILNYYNNFRFESKQKDIQIIKELIKNDGKEFNYVKYLEDYNISLKMNKRFPIIKYLFEINNNSEIKKEEELNIFLKKWESLEEKINDKKLKEIIDEDNQNINNYINIPENKDIFINVFNEDIYELYINYNNKNENNKKEKTTKVNSESPTDSSSKQEDINNNLNINEIISKSSINLSSSNNNQKIYSNSNPSIKRTIIEDTNLKKSDSNNDLENNYNNNYTIIELKKSMFKYNYTSEFIKELSTNNYISFGINNSKKLMRKDKTDDKKKTDSPFLFHYYRNDFEIEKEGYINNWINNIEEGFENDKNMIIFCFDDDLRTLKVSDAITTKDYEDNSNKKYYNSLFKVEKDKAKNFFLLCQKDKVCSVYYSISRIMNNCPSGNIINEKYPTNYKEGIYIDKTFCALTSNRIIDGGKDKMIFFNYKNYKIIKKFEGYSFILSTTGLCLMNTKDDSDKILLCACKKYIKGQKNGILLINNLKNINESDKIFYNTNNFEVHCFCPILINEVVNFFKNSKFKKTNYFFVGGFDKNRNKGIIKLYRIKKGKKIKIEEIKEIYKKKEIVDINKEDNKEFKGFKGPITSIIQSTKNGNIIVSCWDGNVYLFKKPNSKSKNIWNFCYPNKL